MSNIDCINPQIQSPLNISSKDKFIMVINLPYVLRKRAQFDPNIDTEPLQVSVHGTIVPDISVPPIEARYEGQHLHVTSYTRATYPPLTVNFVVDNSYRNYYFLWRWLDIMNTAKGSLYGGTPQLSPAELTLVGDQFEYQTTIDVIALNEYNEPTIEFKYTKAFITRLGGIQYSYRDGAIIEGSADFHFSQLDVQFLSQKTINNSIGIT